MGILDLDDDKDSLLNDAIEGDVGYVSPADFDEPEKAEDAITVKDEINLSTLEEVLVYIDREIKWYESVHSLKINDKENKLTIGQQLTVNKELVNKLLHIKGNIELTIDGIQVKYDERNR